MDVRPVEAICFRTSTHRLGATLPPMHDTPLVPGTPAALVRKPASVWWLQGVAVVVIGVFATAAVKVAWDLMTGAASNPARVLQGVAFASLVAAGLVLAVVGCQRRKEHGRLLGLLFIAAIFLAFGAQWLGILAQIRRPELARESLGGLHAGAGVGVAMLVLTGYWFHAFGFSASARAYFGLPARR